jgi:hypothetical protein
MESLARLPLQPIAVAIRCQPNTYVHPLTHQDALATEPFRFPSVP